MIISLILIEICDLSHLFVCKSEVQDIQIVLYVICVLASRDYDKAHLGVPAEDYLRRTLTVFLSEPSENRFIDKRLVAVAQRIPAHELYVVLIEYLAELFLCEVGVSLNLNELRYYLPLCLKLFNVFTFEVRDTDALCFAFLICLFELAVTCKPVACG